MACSSLTPICLGAKDGFWNTATAAEIDAMLKKMDQVEDLRDVEPAYLAKLVYRRGRIRRILWLLAPSRLPTCLKVA